MYYILVSAHIHIISHFIFLGNVTIGKWCVADLQCTGTQYASLCQNGLCSCRSGFAAYHNNCFPGIPCHEQFWNLGQISLEETVGNNQNILRFQ